MLSEQVQAILDPRNPGLLWREFQTALLEERGHKEFDFMLQQFLRAACDDMLVG
jgi:hypothetical protein